MTVSISHMTSFREMLAEWWSPTTFTLRWPILWATPKGFSPPSQDWPFSDAEPFVVCRGSSSMPPASFTPATSCMYAPFPPSRLKTFLMHMPNGNPELGSSWISLSKLVSRGESHTSTCGRTLSLGSRDKNSGPRATRMSQTTTSQCGGSSKAFSMFKQTILIIPNHPIILDSFAALIQQLNRSE
jgi:hypothetical protein